MLVLNGARGTENGSFKESTEFKRVFVIERRDILPEKAKGGEEERVFNDPPRDSGKVTFASVRPRKANSHRDMISDSMNVVVVL